MNVCIPQAPLGSKTHGSRNNLTKESRISHSICPKQTNTNCIGQERDRTHQCASEDVDDDRPQHHGTNSQWCYREKSDGAGRKSKLNYQRG